MKRSLGTFVLGMALALPASAGMLATPVQSERARVRAMVERPEVRAGLQEMGIPPHEAAARVDAMDDAEVAQVAGKLDAALAGGQVGDRTLLLLLLIILLILII